MELTKSFHFEWTKDMSVGEATIDAQHERLLGQVNTLIDAMVFGAASKEVAEAMHFFEQYIDEHLAYEEEYMEKLGFADIAEHKKKHDEFRAKYAAFKANLQGGHTSETMLVEIEGFLGWWWVNHIGHEDKKYYLAGKKSVQ